MTGMYLFLLSHSSTCHRMHWIIYADEIHALPFDLAKAGSIEIMGDLFNERFEELTRGWTHTGVWWLTLMWVDLSCWLLVFWDESAFKEMHIFNSGNRHSVRRCVSITPAFPLIVSKHRHFFCSYFIMKEMYQPLFFVRLQLCSANARMLHHKWIHR